MGAGHWAQVLCSSQSSLLKSETLAWAVADLNRFNFYFKRTVRYSGFCCRWYVLEEKMATLLFNSVACGLTCTEANWYSQFGIKMSKFRDELTRLAVAERDKREGSVLSNPGMHFPWLQERIETVGKWANIEDFLIPGSAEIAHRYKMNNRASSFFLPPLLFYFICCYCLDRVLLFIPDWPGTHLM